MARANLLLSLVDAASEGDTLMLRQTIEALAAEERAKNHHVLADELSARLARTQAPARQGLIPIPNTDLWYERVPRLTLDDLVLDEAILNDVHRLIEEQHRADLLRAHGLEPRSRILLSGLPGNGKTTLAEAIAEALVVPIIVPRYESIVGSYLGETSQRLRQLFDYAALRRCVLFLDEFDTVGKERADEHETGEIKRVVSSLLMQIDQLPSHVVVICATNHPEILDRAVWRRFELRAELNPPNPAQIVHWFERFARRYKIGITLKPSEMSELFSGANFSALEQFGLRVLRRVVLEQPGADFKTLLKRELALRAQGRQHARRPLQSQRVRQKSKLPVKRRGLKRPKT